MKLCVTHCHSLRAWGQVLNLDLPQTKWEIKVKKQDLALRALQVEGCRREVGPRREGVACAFQFHPRY